LSHRRATHLTISIAEGFKYELPNLECTRESASYLTSEEAAEADRLLEVYKDNDHSDILSNIPVGKFTPLFGVANLETWGIRLNEGGDSIFRHLAEGLEACKKDGNFACKYKLYSYRRSIANIVVVGCHPAFANGDYYICLKRKDSCFFSCD
jgi:hypothetical protein